jgi:hypothetical protein
MRHLKLFLEGFDKSEYYVEIPESEFYDILRFGISSDVQLEDNIGLEYYDRLKGDYKSDLNIRLGLSTRISSIINKVVRIILIDSSGMIRYKGQIDRLRDLANRPYMGYYVEVYGLGDEWFLVYFEDYSKAKNEVVYYKCDQFEGLVELLGDKKMIS